MSIFAQVLNAARLLSQCVELGRGIAKKMGILEEDKIDTREKVELTIFCHTEWIKKEYPKWTIPEVIYMDKPDEETLRNMGDLVNENGEIANDFSPSGAEPMIGASSCSQDGEQRTVFFTENILSAVKLHEGDADRQENDILAMVLHEFYHIQQFEWLYRHGGYCAVERALMAEAEMRYGEGPIECGAYNFLVGIEQDFAHDLGEFL